MGLSKVTYNGYTFPDRSNFSVKEDYVYDDANWTIKATRFKLRVESIIVNETAPDPLEDILSSYCGAEVHRVRQLISKVGAELIIEHDGFTGRPHLRINSSSAGVKDVAMGPKPKLLEWTPIHTHAAEIVWECEFEIPICDGTSPPAFKGLSSFNYWISYDIDEAGYTTRRITGSLEIALTRNGRTVPDTVEDYRDKVIIRKPHNFKRNVNWSVSPDRRRADFTIVDAEIRSPNIYPAGVVNIQCNHTAGWSRRQRAHIPNTIRCTIELVPDEPRWRAWEIFSSIVRNRRRYAESYLYYCMLEAVEISEELFENRISFFVSYRLAGDIQYGSNVLPAPEVIWGATGVMQPLKTNEYNNPWPDKWKDWNDSVLKLNPLQGDPLKRDYGLAGLKQLPYEDNIVDLCSQVPPNPSLNVNPVRPAEGYQLPTAFTNPAPPPGRSWLRWEAKLLYIDSGVAAVSVTLAPNDIQHRNFNPNSPVAQMPSQRGDVRRFIESHAGAQEFVWSGFAERVGYPIEPPGNLLLGGRLLVPVGTGTFECSVTGNHFGQPVYTGMWYQKYRFQNLPQQLDPKESTPQ